jgi:predicted enzyme related to lactoylglutathione lyase
MNVTVQRLQNTYLVARDAGALAQFYQSALQLQQKFRDGDHWIQFDAGGHNFAIAGPREAALTQGVVVVFEVNDLAAVCQRFEELGGRVDSIRDMGSHGKVATLLDIDGNTIQCFQGASQGVRTETGTT